MEQFFPEQRWTSEAEPELGIGIVTATSKGRVHLLFRHSGETRLYAAENAPLRRVRFKAGDSVLDKNGRSMVIERVRESGDLIVYEGEGRALSEADLGDIEVQHGANDRLLSGEVDTPYEFALRRRTLEYDHSRRISEVKGFLGGRIDLIPHQLYIAHEVSSRYAPRVLLSDEVGLGKTIEACLILHRLLLSGRISRVLILVPDSLIHQWFVELLRRFNLWFHIFDEERCLALEEGAPEGNPFLDDQLVICSTSFLAASPQRTMQALTAGWDLLVVDEAHHLEWSPDQPSREYQVVEVLSQKAAGLLLLTATPEQLGAESHFARLRLLDPDRYSDFRAFEQESTGHQKTADIVEQLARGNELNAAQIKFLESLTGESYQPEKLVRNPELQDKLIQDLLDQHGPGRVIFRNRRVAMKGFPKRKAHLKPLTSDQPHLDQAILVPKDPRIEWLIKLMQDLDPAKALLICRHKETVLALEKAIKDRVKLKVGVFHEDLTLVQRDRNAAWFSEPNGARLLICSEIGSEGRNFQFAHHLILFDLPPHPELLEQRIGRLDRIGQSRDIQIHVPYLKGSAQEVLVKWYHNGLNAFEQNLESGDRAMQQFGDRLGELLATANSGPELSALIKETRTFQRELRKTLARGRDRLLEMNSFRPKVAKSLIRQIKNEDLNPGLELYMTEVFEHFTIEVEDIAPQTYLLHPHYSNAVAFPGIPDDGIVVTFDRELALSREEISFLTWDHPMVTGAIDLILGSGTGTAAFGMMRGSGPPAILLEAVFVLETAGSQGKGVDRFLPQTPLRVVVDHSGTDLTADYTAEELFLAVYPAPIDHLLNNDVLVETIFPNMLHSATRFAEKAARAEMEKGMQKMLSTLDHEIGRLRTLQDKNNHIRPDEIRIAEEARSEMAALIGEARIRLDAVMLVQKGEA